jgi:hypothetical protein
MVLGKDKSSMIGDCFSGPEQFDVPVSAKRGMDFETYFCTCRKNQYTPFLGAPALYAICRSV